MADWKLWLKGFGAAMLGGAIASAAQAIVAPGPLTGRSIGTAAVAGAGLTAAAYLKQSPVGKEEKQ
jgi:hypothetical protein